MHDRPSLRHLEHTGLRDDQLRPSWHYEKDAYFSSSHCAIVSVKRSSVNNNQYDSLFASCDGTHYMLLDSEPEASCCVHNRGTPSDGGASYSQSALTIQAME